MLVWLAHVWFPGLVSTITDAAADLADAVSTLVNDHPRLSVLVLIAATTAAGGRLAWKRGEGLRVRTETAKEKLALPAGVAAMWAVVYGFGCWVAMSALLVAHWHRTGSQVVTNVVPLAETTSKATKATPVLTEDLVWFSVIWLGTLAVILTVVVPFVVTFALRRRINADILLLTLDRRSGEQLDQPAGTPERAPEDPRTAFVRMLRNHGLSFVYLLHEDGTLTKRGEWLYERYQLRHSLETNAPTV